jgi:uncharacterized protein YyaL (SSP411 family)
MLRAFAEAALYLNRDDYRQVAVANAQFLLDTLWDGQRLLHNFKDGRARFNGYLDDYANLADGLLALYGLTFESRWLEHAITLVNKMIEQFWDATNGGFYFTAANHEELISRTKDFFDNATPSGNSVAADVLVRMAALLDRDDYRQIVNRILESTGRFLKQHPSALSRLLEAVDFQVGPSREIAIVGDPAEFLPVLRAKYLPRSVIAGGDARIPLLKDRPPVAGKPTAYVCENYVCKQPVTTSADLERQL